MDNLDEVIALPALDSIANPPRLEMTTSDARCGTSPCI
jgi:hypothetical protein